METQTETTAQIAPAEPMPQLILPPQNVPQTDAELREWMERRKAEVRAATGAGEAPTRKPGKVDLTPHRAFAAGRVENSQTRPARIFRAELQPAPSTCPNCQTECVYTASSDISHFGSLTTYVRPECLCEAALREKHEAIEAARKERMDTEARRARIAQYRQNSGIYGDLWNRTFDAFDPSRDELAASAFRTVRAWAETFKPGETKRGFVLSSPGFGCGKSHLSVAAGIHILGMGHSVKYLSLAKWLAEQRAEFQKSRRFVSYESRDDEPVGKVGSAMKAAINCAVLIIDDLGAEQIRAGEEGDWARQQIFQLLDDRANFGRPVIATTNLDIKGITARIGGEHGGRCGSRLLQVARLLEMDGPDGRLL